MIRLAQLQHPKKGRRVGLVQSDRELLLLTGRSIYELALEAVTRKISLKKLISKKGSAATLNYQSVYDGKSDWQLLPAFDHPDEPARCLVTGTGLTHRASAENRQAMHLQSNRKKAAAMTDSMRMYQWGLKGGRPHPGKIGVPPEWFYKGCGTILRAHGQPLEVPAFGEDGGEEPEVAGAYVIDAQARPWRVGLVAANEFSDHQMEGKNYLYLAPSKLRTCSIGPELMVGASFDNVPGTVRILRKGKPVWTKQIFTGERNMSHTLANLEHHHFKYPAHRRPGDAHLHFFGADAFSFGEGIALKNGDVMELQWSNFGRPLRNPIRILPGKQPFVRIRGL